MIEVDAEEAVEARIDPDRFEQVLSNVLGNAVTHGDPNRPVRMVLASRENGISLTVHNWGEPIHPDFLPLLFNPFARVDKVGRRSAGLA